MSNPDPAGQRATYSADHFDPLFAAEERHFWFRSRNRCIAAATSLIPDSDSIKNIVEHGCGTGFVLAELQRLFPQARVVGTDLFEEGLALARLRFAGPLIRTDVHQWGNSEAFDLVGFFDVLEHLDDELRVLRALREQLRPGGHLLVTVPAHMALWSAYDVACGHRRRYNRSRLETRLQEAGFEVKFCTYFMSVLLPLMWARRRLFKKGAVASGDHATEKHRIESEVQIYPPLNYILERLLRPESWWIRHGRRLGCGTSLLALAARKRAS
jgi:SAM-dependent methyltransferase